MKIVQIIPGSGGSFYCGNCMRDSKYIAALRAQGLDIVVIPMYLPLFPQEENKEAVPVFYGAVSLYLKTVFPFLRKAPAWVDRMLNAPSMLKLAAKMANSTRSTGLEGMTLSMLKGEMGQQKQELDTLIQWLENHYQPDLIHLSNALLLGMAQPLKQALKVPVVCTLQDEDVWVDAMRTEFQELTWNLMREKAKDVDLFVSVSTYFSKRMQALLDLKPKQLTTLHLGVDPSDYTYVSPVKKGRSIGFLSRMCAENGLDILVDAFLLLKQKPEFSDCRLVLTGGHTSDDQKYIAQQMKKFRQAGCLHSVDLPVMFDELHKRLFFEQVSVLSVPVRNGEAFGIYLTEAMASGVPVVQPNLGAFPEIIEKSCGGVNYGQNTPENLAHALEKIFSDRSLLEQLSWNARKSTESTFNIRLLALKLGNLYRDLIEI